MSPLIFKFFELFFFFFHSFILLFHKHGGSTVKMLVNVEGKYFQAVPVHKTAFFKEMIFDLT